MAPEHEARTRVLYDHESDEPRHRRHAVADWGVGEDIFDRMPSRRFARTDRRAEHSESRTIVISRAAPADIVEAPPAEEPRSEPAPARTFVIETATPPDEAPAAKPEPIAAEPPARRTVVIRGTPEWVPAVRPPRPPRTAMERVGTSPDRIVAYAVALGFLLVLIAILTTGQ